MPGPQLSGQILIRLPRIPSPSVRNPRGTLLLHQAMSRLTLTEHCTAPFHRLPTTCTRGSLFPRRRSASVYRKPPWGRPSFVSPSRRREFILTFAHCTTTLV